MSKCDKCKLVIINDVYYKYHKHPRGLILCDTCFRTDEKRPVLDLLDIFAEWNIEYTGDEGHENYIDYLKFLDYLSLEHDKLARQKELIEKIDNEDYDEWGEDFMELWFDIEQE